MTNQVDYYAITPDACMPNLAFDQTLVACIFFTKYPLTDSARIRGFWLIEKKNASALIKGLIKGLILRIEGFVLI